MLDRVFMAGIVVFAIDAAGCNRWIKTETSNADINISSSTITISFRDKELFVLSAYVEPMLTTTPVTGVCNRGPCFKPSLLESLTKSASFPYDNVVVPLSVPNIDHAFARSDFDSYVANYLEYYRNQQSRAIRIWPGVYMSTIILGAGCDGVDLNIDDPTSRASMFLSDFTVALQVARDMHSPGIVVDLEEYAVTAATNSSSPCKRAGRTTNSLWQLTQNMNIARDDLIKKLRTFGNRMEDLVKENYPGAVLFFPYTALGEKLQPPSDYVGQYTVSYSYIVEGILARMRDTGYTGTKKLISSGERSLDYYKPFQNPKLFFDIESSPDPVVNPENKVRTREDAFAPYLDQYFSKDLNRGLTLGGTIAPWNWVCDLNGWVLRGWRDANNNPLVDSNGNAVTVTACLSDGTETAQFQQFASADAPRDARSFKPYISKLFTTYRYNFVYTGTGTKYNPFNLNSSSTENLNQIIKDCFQDGGTK